MYVSLDTCIQCFLADLLVFLIYKGFEFFGYQIHCNLYIVLFPYNIFVPQVIFTFMYSSVSLFYAYVLFSYCLVFVLFFPLTFNSFVIYFVGHPNANISEVLKPVTLIEQLRALCFLLGLISS